MTGKASFRRCPNRKRMNKYRYSDYYEMTNVFDTLYEKSCEGAKFTKLMDIITSSNNIKLAYRMIKSNTGSKTAGVDGITIKDLKDKNIEDYVNNMKSDLSMYKPNTVRRVFIPKNDGKKLRPLGIPTMRDRLIQQAIKQVLEPICEAKFHPHSYGFRPNRSAKHAVARINYLINQTKLNYVVDVDIKGFFDNVNHTKLIKQLYSIGIQDRKLLTIIKTMLKAPIENEGIPTKGTPQGGILSPLLANVVLNELDWWISSQWETFKTNHGYDNVSNKFRAIKKTNLKMMYIVRYADDFKIVCKSYNQAKRIFTAVTEWLKIRLDLDISPEKSKVVNLRNKCSDFLGIKIKARPKSEKYVAHSFIGDKAKNQIVKSIKEQVKKVRDFPTPENVNLLNSIILGIHNYYNMATHVNKDFAKIAFSVNRTIFNRLKNVSKYKKVVKGNEIYRKFYGDSTAKTWHIAGIPIFPVHYIQHKSIMAFSQDINDYTPEGRKLSSKALGSITDNKVIELARRYVKERSVEYNDNRVSRASMAKFKCEVTGLELDIDDLHAHHKIPRYLGGNDEFNNLKIVHKDINTLIHATSKEVIDKFTKYITNKTILKKLNTLRSYCKLEPLAIEVKNIIGK